jgi:hypothetical protein
LVHLVTKLYLKFCGNASRVNRHEIQSNTKECCQDKWDLPYKNAEDIPLKIRYLTRQLNAGSICRLGIEEKLSIFHRSKISIFKNRARDHA